MNSNGLLMGTGRISGTAVSRRAIVPGILAVLVFLAFQSCARHEPLSPLEQRKLQTFAVTNGRAVFTPLNGEKMSMNTKFIFIIDVSGSNQSGDQGTNGTDVNGIRFDKVKEFISTQPPVDPSTFYGYITFGNNATIKLEFTPDPQVLSQAMDTEKATVRPAERTNYEDALGHAANMIAQDIAQAAKDKAYPSNYVIFFISDGMPNPMPTPATYQFDREVQALMQLKEGAYSAYVGIIKLHTGFYTSPEATQANPAVVATASALLKHMAEAGNGDTMVFSDVSAIDFAKFTIPPRMIPVDLSDIFVTNANAVWWYGRYMRDSDGDGFPDDVELRGFNEGIYLFWSSSDPNRADSDYNGVSDYVEWKNSGKISPCGDPDCQVNSNQRSFRDQCQSYYVSGDDTPANPTVYKNSNFDPLNDCERYVLGLRINHFDDSGNGVPDFLELVNGMMPQQGKSQAFLDTDGDGLTNYLELKLGYQRDLSNSSFTDFKPFVYDYKTVHDQTGTHYVLNVTQVPYIGAPQTNLIRVYLMENTFGAKDVRYMRIAEKFLSASGQVNLTDDDFGPLTKMTCLPQTLSEACN